ncbi:hypothetical protein [Massilia sp. erpn]|uniref:hypothetical protein n=1 Tax=Massilia sp. erpn TaxID=2738142 RepID=UPI0021032BAF|nr:hypothetical protein [Massilia sp. erpn]UTY59638.1 hypothetical protein HPQ68_22155 [Massilia sp. erpn]
MAIWQFKLEVIPSALAGARDVIPEKEWADCSWWLDSNVPHEMLEELSRILPPHESWSIELSQWGLQNSDLIEIWQEGQAIESISARIDARELNLPFVKRLLQIVEKWDCRLVYSRYRTILPQAYAEFIEALNDSPNFKVIGNQEEWLPRMANEVAQNERDAGTAFKI